MYRKRRKRAVQFAVSGQVLGPKTRYQVQRIGGPIFTTNDPVEGNDEGFKFPNSRKWTQRHLDLLGVEMKKEHFDLDCVLNQNEEDWAPDVCECIIHPFTITSSLSFQVFPWVCFESGMQEI